jgi:alpha-N-acetylglucosamine transferase
MYNYTKLRIFGLIEFKKIIFLDADMIILRNIDHLFERPHMSACNSGGEIEKYKGWRYFNSGLMVIEPAKELFDDMISKIGKIETEKNKGDQAFLHAYYSDWPNKPKLHLPHVYNVLITHLNDYINEHDYTIEHESGKTPMYVLHYVGSKKPWNVKKNSAEYANILWHLHSL